MQNLFANIEYYYEKTKMIAAASVLVAVLNIILNYVFIDIFGYMAAAYTTLFCYMVYAVVHFFVMSSICKRNNLDIGLLFNMRTVIGLSFIALALMFIMTAIYKYILFRYSIVVLILLTGFVLRKQIKKIFNTVKERDNP